MNTIELNTAKVNLARYILNETDAKLIEKLLHLVYEKKGTTEKPKSLAPHLGKLKRGIDGLAYQKTIRSEWD